ncbi:glycine/D-amino acid oxidase-like deaminating enzyme [Roseibium hamelinense]|uniref:Glycine/D-amino acid oxidase-like deaminating enzyme n=1 Tax=Roseibium hamelinense TaxID=150831 RepID=A0A562T180_9HYPH|nr:FAD-binding oxidoreductase [Roseibium hamelinense]MTI44423.1 FAD-binding oxidoreductase [Roseibium hamelinense]TWI87389.1 glycine/D-amino acid oxidase-like deaminating enzyme [Roseibium hamelinense]
MSVRAATSLPSLQGPAAWNRILPEPAPAAPLGRNITADIVVIGAGFAGLSAARRLKQIDASLSVVVLEAARIADGSAGRNSGFMIDLPHELTSEDYSGSGDDRAMIALNRQAIAFGRDAVDAYQINQNYFDPAGKVNGAASAAADAHNASYAQHLESLGETYERLDQQQMREMTGSRHYQSGLYTPGTVMLQPAGYIRGLASGLARQGVAIFEETPALSFEKRGTGWQVTTPGATVQTAKIILTVNGHLESFGFERGRLMQLFLFAVMTPELEPDALKKLGGQPRWGITPSDPMGTTLRRIDSGQGGNRIVTRTCALLKSGMRVQAHAVYRAANVMQRKFDARFPQLAGLKMEYAWAGHLCLSLNSVSVMRQVEEGVYAGCVQNGLGTTRGTLTGIGAADQALGISSHVTRYFSKDAPPVKLPPQPLRDIGANAVLRWKEWRASAE